MTRKDIFEERFGTCIAYIASIQTTNIVYGRAAKLGGLLSGITKN